MRIALPILALLAGCPKATVPQAPVRTPVRVAHVVQSATEGPLDGDELATEAIVEAITARNLTPQLVELRAPARERLAALEGAGLALLVESRARFSSQMNGRYRWTVDVQAQLADGQGAPYRADFTVPVHLIYAHEQELAALDAAAPSIARRVGGLLDEWVKAQR